jgi:hypothetical protein
MKSQLGFAAWILAAIVGTTGAAAGQITPSDDSYTDTATPTTNLGAKITLGVSSAAQTSFIRFDLTSIPAGYTGANIGKATLKLYVNSVATAGSFNVVYVNGSWSENTITANLSPALGGPITSNVPLVKANAKDFLLVDITSALAAWLNGSQPNDGIALVANSPLAATFETKENTAQGHSPELDVVFASGGGGTITGITTAAGSGLTGGTNSGVANLSLLTSCSNGQILAWNGTGWACKTVGGTGTVTSVGLAAPASDFVVSGSPVTTSGTLNLAWNTVPTANNTANAIVKRDASGTFTASFITVTQGLLSQVSAANGPALLGQSLGSGFTKGVWGLSAGSGAGSAGVVGGDSNSIGSSYTAGVLGSSANPKGIGVLGQGSSLSAVGNTRLGTAAAGVWADSKNFGLVATSDLNSIVAYNNNAGASTMYVENDTTASNGLIFYATAPNVTSNGFPATCSINTHADLGCNGNVKADGSLRVGQDATQPPTANGMVKALLYFDSRLASHIVSCFNSQLAEPAASTPPCGFTVRHVDAGENEFDFGFTVSNRIIQVTAVYVGSIDSDLVSAAVENVSGTKAVVLTFYSTLGLSGETDTPFYLAVF